MPNADLPRPRSSPVSRVEFGSTVREICVDFRGEWRQAREEWQENPHARYMREAAERRGTAVAYADLPSVFIIRT